MSAAQPTPFPDLNAVLFELVASVQAILAENFIAAWLQGSFAVGDFDQHSDVDFIIAVDAELLESQVADLQVMHPRIFGLECPWAQHLEGSYFPKDVLRSFTQRSIPLWYLDNGSRSLIQSEHCNTVVVRWVLREHGILLAGPHPTALIDPIPVRALRQEILDTMRAWGKQILADPDQINSRFYQGFAVFHYCRSLHSLQAGTVGSKRAGADWAKSTLDPVWVGLIDRSWNTRPNPAVSVRQPADPRDLSLTLEFVQYALDVAAQFAETFEINEKLT
jgi:hypothetical protein